MGRHTTELDSTKVTQPGTFTGSLFAEADSPYLVKPVDVAMQVSPPSGWGLFDGAVTEASGNPVPGATVQIGTRCTSVGHCASAAYTVKTNHSGYYQWWLDEKDNSLQLIAAKDGYIQQVTTAKTVAGHAVSTDRVPQMFGPGSVVGATARPGPAVVTTAR